MNIHNGTFLNTSFRGTTFENIQATKCNFNEIVFDDKVDLSYTKIIDCKINGLKVFYNDEDFHLEYSPEFIRSTLKKYGAKIIDTSKPIVFPEEVKEYEIDKSVFRLLRAMQRTTFISKNSIETRLKLDKKAILETIIPLMVKHGILEERKDKGDVWMLRTSYQDLSISQNEKGTTNIHQFWKEIHK